MRIVLASGSPRRRKLIKLLGLPYRIEIPKIDEKITGTPESIVISLARKKAMAVNYGEEEIIVAADTVVSIENKVLGKPDNFEEAYDILKLLSGNWHQVYTGVFVITNFESFGFFEKTYVKFRDIPDEFIRYYIASGNPFDKAGGYGIQEVGGLFVEKIVGDYYNVVGLPISRLWFELYSRGYIRYDGGATRKTFESRS
ncbi:septum formation protein Maf [Thermosipho ferrireducens]|uniref:dTTP/UTP pyrophosphatase n=1 Tax=Thermosipho ferrireducens TaxID=2571116 RepID=A0ABX7SA90_9BACT|nr:Maf family protein [Thermosipho ferrireducens]QTA38840.1 septum formation protein Maf [Thermosipho ferrireducens]